MLQRVQSASIVLLVMMGVSGLALPADAAAIYCIGNNQCQADILGCAGEGQGPTDGAVQLPCNLPGAGLCTSGMAKVGLFIGGMEDTIEVVLKCGGVVVGGLCGPSPPIGCLDPKALTNHEEPLCTVTVVDNAPPSKIVWAAACFDPPNSGS